MTELEIKRLLQGYRQGTLNEAEVRTLEEYIARGEYEEWVKGDIQEALQETPVHPLWTKDYSEQLFAQLKRETIDKDPLMRPVHRVHFLKTTWFKYAAAVLIIITGVAVSYTSFHTSHSKPATASTEGSAKADVMPGSDRAVLTLSNGQQIQLNTAASETIKDGTLSIKNTNGLLSYADNESLYSPNGAGSQSYNTMSTPRGGQYKLTLSDGTKVWLNAASSITYPTTFTGKTREVTIKGEAYFEVTPNKEKPFIVQTAKEQITVLGTAFNVNAYPDELTTKTTLVEGSVALRSLVSSRETVLQPGQAYTSGKVIITDIEQDVAWKNGYFNMQSVDINTVMRSISRWYNINVVYKRKLSGKFTIEISRNTSLSDVLKILEETGEVKPVMQGNTVIIQ